MFAGWKRISTALTVLAAVSATTTSAQAQGPSTNPNQATADGVAAALTRSPILFGQRIAVEARQGLVILSGAVSNPEQHREAMELARLTPGVTAVQDLVRVIPDAAVVPARYQPTSTSPPQVALGGMFGGGAGMYGGTGSIPSMGPGEAIGSGIIAGDPNAPTPEGMALAPGTSTAPQPGFPNYAWPSYAPYPNFSAVGYPTAYPWQAWPNIGPFYPYPEVPLDWRAVTLRWDDGIWWLDFKKHYTRPFFTPYPFGLFAY
jgi:hypothetical protein